MDKGCDLSPRKRRESVAILTITAMKACEIAAACKVLPHSVVE
jgi:hypothetical protein